VGIFLNGTRTDDGRISHPQLGAALIAARTGTPLLPLAIRGTERILPRGSGVPRLQKLSVHFGAPIAPPPSSERAALRRIAAECTEKIHTLLDLSP
jgi:1-acyl-sn-glycerol-3-phosphate acyltransferase